MKAEDGKTYGIIVNNKLHAVFTKANLPEWNENHLHTVDITNLTPEIGDVYDGSLFSKPVPDDPIEVAERAYHSIPLLIALIRLLAKRFNLTEAQVRQALRNEMTP